MSVREEKSQGRTQSNCFFKFFVHVITTLLLLAGVAQAWQGMATPKLHVDGRYLKDPSGKIVTLHGWMQPTSSYFNGRFYRDPRTFTPQDCAESLNVYKSIVDLLSNPEPLFGYDHGWYNNFVRIWPPSDGWRDDGTVDEELQDRAWRNMYIPYVEHCKARGIYVVFVGNAPEGGEFMGAQYKSNLIAYWTRICNEYPEIKNADNVMFEICNEPINIESQLGNGDWGSVSDAHDRAVQTYFQDIVDEIRATGFDNVIWVPGLIWQDRLMNFARYPIAGGNIGYAGHMYPFGANDVDDINNRFVNSGWKACSDLYPVIVTEGSWHTLADDQGLRTGTTEVFGVTVRNFYDTQGNISWICGMTEELIGGMSGGISSFTYPEINSGRAGFHWWPDYVNTAPTNHPTGLSSEIKTEGQIDLAWSGVPEALSYNIKRSIVSGGPYTSLASGILATEYVDTDVVAGQTYYYIVTANMSDGESPDSNESTPVYARSYLRFEETSGTIAYDSSGNSWNGSLFNGASFSSGVYGNGVSLDGSNDYLALPTGVVNGLAEYTISTWVYLNNVSTWSRVFDFGTGTSVNMFLTPRHSNNSGTVRFAITNNGGGSEQRIDGSEALPSGVWTHVAVTLSGTTGTLYVNGSAVGQNTSMTLNPQTIGNTTQNYIGRSQYPDPYLNGKIDEFRIYSKALSSTDIKMLYQQQMYALSPTVPGAFMSESISSSQVILTWDEVANTTNYNVKRSDNPAGPFEFIAGTGTGSYSDSGLLESTEYYYVVSAVNNAGESLDSTISMVITDNNPPAAPSGLLVTAGGQAAILSWQASSESDLAGYNIYRSIVSGGDYSRVNDSLVTQAQYSDDTVNIYTSYYYIVTAVDDSGMESEYSQEVECFLYDSEAVLLDFNDFESGWGNWQNITGQDSHNWYLNTGKTITPYTGPSGGNNSSRYAYLETSPGHASRAGDTAILELPQILGSDRIMTLYYHMYGEKTGTLAVDVYDGTWHQGVWSVSGQQHSASEEAYSRAFIDLRTFVNPLSVRIRAISAGSPSGDMAIDDISIYGKLIYGDLDCNGIIDINDLALFGEYWLKSDCSQDLDGDCVITLYEFSEFAKNWLKD